MPRRYPPEFRRKVLDLVAAGRPVAQVAPDLVISAQVICTWRRQHRIDSGQVPGITSSDQAELVAARKRIAELETELAIHLQATELLGRVVPPKRRFEAIAVMATGFGGPGADHHLGVTMPSRRCRDRPRHPQCPAGAQASDQLALERPAAAARFAPHPAQEQPGHA